MVEKMKTDVDRLLLILITENEISKMFCEINLFPFSKPNLVYLCPFLTSLQFPKLKKKFYVL